MKKTIDITFYTVTAAVNLLTCFVYSELQDMFLAILFGINSLAQAYQIYRVMQEEE